MGRRKGSRNLTPEERLEKQRLMESQPKRGRGRPKGSVKKPKEAEVEVITAQETVSAEPEKKKAGRPKGAKSGYTVSEKALAKRREVLAIKEPKTDEDRDFNARLIMHIMQINELAAQADKNDLVSLKSCFLAYLQLCQQNGFCVSNLCAYASMGFDYKTFEYFSRRDNPEVKAFCRFIKETCAMFRENMVANNKLNPVIGIFWQRNYDGLRNDTEQVQAAQEQDDDTFGGSQSYKDKYRKLIGGD